MIKYIYLASHVARLYNVYRGDDLKQNISIRIEKDLLEEIDREAEETGRTRTNIIEKRLSLSSPFDELDEDLKMRMSLMAEKTGMAHIRLLNNVIREGISGLEKVFDFMGSSIGGVLGNAVRPFLTEEEKINFDERSKNMKEYKRKEKTKKKKS